jgi:DNA-directed RNA polymerase subunit RPC12/RpoP
MEPSSGQAPPELAAQEQPGKSAVSLLAELQRAKTTANGIKAEEGAPAPSSQLEAGDRSSEGMATAQPPIEAPGTEIDAQDAMMEPGQAPGPAVAGEGPAAEGGTAQGPAAEGQAAPPVTRVRCASCKAAIPVFSAQRPLVVTCPQCGRMGMLK